VALYKRGLFERNRDAFVVLLRWGRGVYAVHNSAFEHVKADQLNKSEVSKRFTPTVF
jgi:hypothetical protein